MDKTESFFAEQPDDFLVVGIGASAGGVQALQEFFQNVPASSGIAWVAILHLSPDHDSQLTQILQRVAAIPVMKVTEKIKVEPDHIYVVSPSQHLVVQDENIVPLANMQIEDRRAPVDIFFRHLAEAFGPRAVCVVLSGTGANGSIGLKRIKEMGGVAFVQNPREAEFNEMPRNSIATELVDEVLSVAEIPVAIINYRNNIGSVTISVDTEKRSEQQQQALREIFTQLRIRTGHDFTNYKRPTLLRRIERRINMRNLSDLPSYADLVSKNPNETTALLKDLLISVTNFFRDAKPFQSIEEDVLPALLREKKSEDEVRIWVVGCATGEEAYSLAMLFAEQLYGAIDPPKIQIFATDIDEAAIAVAREGLYTINEAADVSAERLRRFFTREGEGYRVRREIREMVLFANHNFLKDPPFSRLHLISCRNVLIYLNNVAQERVMETFHFALNPGSFLFLGTSESVEVASDLFAVANRESHIFKARVVSKKHYPVPESLPKLHLHETLQQTAKKQEAVGAGRISFGELHQKLLEEYAPPSLVVNEEYDIVHMSEKVGKYLEIAGGEPTRNLLKLVRPDLRLELRTALYQAVQKQTAVEARNVKIQLGEEANSVNLHIRPVVNQNSTAKGFILVVFEPDEGGYERVRVVDALDKPIAKQLEEELVRLKVQLRHSNEEHEFQTEELKAANEELQALNEELRSSTEELETSKEELQSINEELRTVNQELKVRIEEISITSNNLQNLINSANVATVFLDRSFRTRLFTEAAREIFSLIPRDYGRSISDITHKLNYPYLVRDAETVLEKLTVIEQEVTTTDNRWYMMRILPYRTSEDRINGVVITFFDITRRKEAEKALQQSEQHLRLLIESARDYAIFGLDTERRVTRWNSGAEMIIGYTPTEIIGKSVDIIFTSEDCEHNEPEKEAEIAVKEGRMLSKRWHVRKDGSRFFGSGSVSPLRDHYGTLLGFVKIMHDLTKNKEAEEALLQSERRFRSLVTATTDIVYEMSADWSVMINLKGMDFLTSTSHPITDWLEKYIPVEAHLQVLDAIKQAIDTKTIFELEHPVRQPNNKIGWVASRAVPLLDPQNEVLGWFGAASDVTGLKQSKAQQTLLAEVSKDLIGSRNLEETIGILGEKIGKHFGVTSCMFFEGIPADTKSFVSYGWHAEASLLKGTNLVQDFLSDHLERTNVGELFVVSDTETECGEDAERYRHLGIRSYLNLSLVQNEITHYQTFVIDNKPRQWRKDEIDLVKEIANRIWTRLEKARAEKALRRSEERLRTLADAVPQIIWTNNAEGDADYFNQRWYDYTGLNYEHSAGLGWQLIVHSEDERGSVEKWKEAFSDEKIFDTEFRLRHRNGTFRWFIGRNVPLINEKGKVTAWFGSATDIQELKKTEKALSESEARLRITMESATDYAIITMDTERRIERWSNGASKIFGYTEAEVIGQSADIIFTDEDQKAGASQKEMETARDKGRAIDERWHQRKDGSRFYVSGVMRPIQNPELTGYVKVLRDMTQQQLFTEELHRLVGERTNDLRRSNEDLQQFAHVASHDLKEPVRKIKTFNNRIRDDFSEALPEKVQMYLNKINSAANRMEGMIEGILKYSQLAQSAAAFVTVDLNKTLENIQSDLEVLIFDKKALITTTDLPTINANETLIYQLFYNLVLNSLKFSKASEPSRIHIKCAFLQQDQKDFTEIILSDNGIGFEQEYANTIFDTFTRLNSQDEYEGTGLGLALCKKIVERHGGSIAATGQVGIGATFTINLPLS